MSDSILTSTKKILGLEENYTAFDLDILTSINSAFATLSQLGVGPAAGFFIEDADATWDDFVVPANQLANVKTYVRLKTRMVFDPPTTGFQIDAMKEQIKEYEWRLNAQRETNGEAVWPPETSDNWVILDGGTV